MFATADGGAEGRMQKGLGPHRWLLGTLASAILLAAAYTPVPAVAAESQVQVGSNLEALGHSDRTGNLDPNQRVDVQLALNLRDPSGVADLVRRISTPGSADYGHYLTPRQFADRFGPTQQQVEAAAGYLRASGLTVTSSATGSTLVNATGTAAQVGRTMHTPLGQYRDRSNGRDFYANDVAPTLPSSVAAVVQAVHGLDNHAVRHSSAAPNACCAGTPYSPAQIRSGYNFNSAPISGLTGSGQTMGLMELNTFSQANVSTFDTAYGLSPPPPQVLNVPPGGVASNNGGEVEVELDIQVMQGIAPAANIMVFEAQNSNIGLNNAYSCMGDPNALGSTIGTRCPNYLSQATAPTNSTSWGLCEFDQRSGETATLDGLLQQAAATGHSFYAASGDTGAGDNCTSKPAVDSPASDPYMTGTGGTKLLLNSGSNTWSSETAWPAEPRNNLGSGGGLSIFFNRPSWQAGPGVLNGFSNGSRQVPDVSLDSDPVTGFSIYTCNNSGGGACNPAFGGIGGTSAAAPAWAAFTAIYNQLAACQVSPKPNLGFANPALYVAANSLTSPFHDITTGSNPNNNPFTITSGWDFLTGLGAYDATATVSKLLNSPTPCPVDPAQSTVVAAPGSVVADGATTSTITVTLKNFTGSPVAGKAVTLAKSAGLGNPSIIGPAPANTNANGQTTFTVKSTTAGQDAFQATDTTDNNLVITQTASVSFTAGAVNAGHSIVSASPGSVPADGFSTSTVTVTLNDVNDNPVSGKAVTVAKSSGPGNPSINGPSPPTTSASGQTTFTVSSTTIGADTFQATDSSDGNLVITQTANVTFTTPPPPQNGVVMDGYGGLHPYGPGSVSTGGSAYWAGWNIARGVVLKTDKSGGYTLDGFGGVHAFGNAPSYSDNSHAYWGGWDIARGIALCGNGTSGYTLDGFGGVHTFGGAQDIPDWTHAYWGGWDIARAIAVRSDCTGGYTMDGFGGIHNFGSASNVPDWSHAYWGGWNIARGFVLRADGSSGYTLDGFGGVHTFGGAPDVPDWSHAYWGGWDIARGIDLSPDGMSGYTLDGWGGVHPWATPGDQPPPTVPDHRPGAYWQGWDIARGLSGD